MKIHYNKNTDYQELIDRAVAKGDLAAAARYERKRNAKIADMNAAGENPRNYTPTHLYSGHLPAADRQDGVGDSGGQVRPENSGGEDSGPASRRPAYDAQLDGLLGELLDNLAHRRPFAYDPDTDPVFESYRSQYLREGDRAVNDTLAALAASAGGANSYALTAARQQQDYYNAQLNDKVPELYQLAYTMYRQQGKDQADLLDQVWKALRE